MLKFDSDISFVSNKDGTEISKHHLHYIVITVLTLHHIYCVVAILLWQVLLNGYICKIKKKNAELTGTPNCSTRMCNLHKDVNLSILLNNSLTLSGLVMPEGDRDLGQHWLRWWLVAWRTKPLPEPMLTDHQGSPVTFIFGQFHNRCLNHQSLKSSWKLHYKLSFKYPRGHWVNAKSFSSACSLLCWLTIHGVHLREVSFSV